MQHKNLLDHNIGILGGGQLGKMLAIEAANWHLPIYILDKDQQFPAVPYAPFFQAGDFKNFDDVVQFGKKVDILTIEIEQINVDALFYLENEGVKVYPKPSTVKVIQDKGLQKMFYQERDIPTAGFQLFNDGKEIKEAFDSIDTDGSGKIDVAELRIALDAIGFDSRKDETNRIIQDLDKNKDGYISYEEFLELLTLQIVSITKLLT